MQTLKVSVSGVRGIIGESLTPQTVVDYTLAYAAFIKRLGNSVAVARDTRKSGGMVFDLVCGTLKASGIDVYDYGILPTPILIYAVKKDNHAGGIIITASHNAEEWNALKFVKNPGVFLNQNDLNALLDIKDASAFSLSSFNSCGKQYTRNVKLEFVNEYIEDLILHFDVKKIRESKFNVAYDPVNSTAAGITPLIMKKIGVQITGINEDINKDFQRGAEPTPENLSGLCERVSTQALDIGFAHDPDADRLSIVDEKGFAVGEEYTLALSVLDALAHKKLKTNIVVNLSTSMMCKNIVKNFGRQVYETKVGEINVTDEMIRLNCEIGGEGNGGVIYPLFNSCRDSFVAIMFVLELMATEKLSLSKIIKTIPKYTILKEKVSLENIEINKLYDELKEKFAGADFSEMDGLKITANDYWIHIRPSNTEPVLRIITESKSKEKNNELLNSVKEIIFA